jgi:hypothetical protein
MSFAGSFVTKLGFMAFAFALLSHDCRGSHGCIEIIEFYRAVSTKEVKFLPQYQLVDIRRVFDRHMKQNGVRQER